MFWTFIDEFRLPVTVGLAVIAAIGYLSARFRNNPKPFVLFDGIQMMFLMIVVTTTVSPAMLAASTWNQDAELSASLDKLRSQISHYKLQHNGAAPVLYQGTFPQLLEATDEEGNVGPADLQHPLGPYLHGRIPPNPITCQDFVTPTDSFPAKAASGNGGWLYNQKTGQIAVDLPDLLEK